MTNSVSADFSLTPPDAAPQRARFLSDPEQVAARMRELSPDLTFDLFQEVLAAGLEARNTALETHPTTAAGIFHWMQSVHVLRDWLRGRQWHIRDERNSPLIISPDNQVAIVVMTGSPETGGSAEAEPTNQAEKGSVTERYVQDNQRQLEIFNQESFRAARDHEKGLQVWVLLYHFDKVQSQVRAVLSFPTGFGKRHITTWGERMVLPAVSNASDDTALHPAQDEQPDATLDIQPRSGAL